MKKKLSKVIFHLSENSRITTKALSKKIKSSQQSSSYLIKQLKKKKIIQDFTTIVDAVKLGLTNIIVGINYLKFDDTTQKEILTKLKNNDSIISIRQANQGVDLIVEYCVSNLSAFNKIHTELSQKLYQDIETKFIFPVVVKHEFNKKYLLKTDKYVDKVLLGDRELKRLNEKELLVLKTLVKFPNATITAITQKTKVPSKTIVKIKKKLEKERIIRGYSCLVDHRKIGINRKIILLDLSGQGIGEIDKLVSFAKTHNNIIELVKIIGEYQLMIIFESINNIDIINDLRSRFSIKNYLVINIEKVLKEQYIPYYF